MSYRQGALVVGSDPFGGNHTRPYLILSNSTHPFYGQEYLAALVTTTERERAVPLAGEYVEGGLPYESFVNPWNVLTIKDDAIEKRVASVSDDLVSTASTEVQHYLQLDGNV